MMTSNSESGMQEQVRAAERYFGSFVDDYHEAFRGKGRGLQGTINRLFRRKTFQRRTGIVQDILARHGLAGKRVLDLGCGSGEVSIVAARLGARVAGVDIVEGMVQVARREAAAAGVAEQTEFRVGDITHLAGETAEVTLLVGVIEYYRDLAGLLAPVAAATRELIVIADTRGPWWRRTLRRFLARAKHFYLYYRDPDEVSAVLSAFGFAPAERITGHSFTVMAFRRFPGGAR